MRRYLYEVSRTPRPRSPPHYVYPSKRRMMASSTLLTTGSGRSRFKTALWIFLGLTALFVCITSEVLLVTDYPMYHAYRLQVIADRHLLIPHSLCGVTALLAGAKDSTEQAVAHHSRLHPVKPLRQSCGFQTAPRSNCSIGDAIPIRNGTIPAYRIRKRRFQLERPI